MFAGTGFPSGLSSGTVKNHRLFKQTLSSATMWVEHVMVTDELCVLFSFLSLGFAISTDRLVTSV